MSDTAEAVFIFLCLVVAVTMLGWTLLVTHPRHQREIGFCEGRGGVWVNDYGCVHPPVPMEVE